MTRALTLTVALFAGLAVGDQRRHRPRRRAARLMRRAFVALVALTLFAVPGEAQAPDPCATPKTHAAIVKESRDGAELAAATLVVKLRELEAEVKRLRDENARLQPKESK